MPFTQTSGLPAAPDDPAVPLEPLAPLDPAVPLEPLAPLDPAEPLEPPLPGLDVPEEPPVAAPFGLMSEPHAVIAAVSAPKATKYRFLIMVQTSRRTEPRSSTCSDA